MECLDYGDKMRFELSTHRWDEEDLMNDEYFTDALHFFHTEESDLKAMTLRERKQVVEQLRKQTNRLIKIVDPKSGYYPETRFT